MPKLAGKLTALAVEKAKSQKRSTPEPDGNGLYLIVAASGLKSWSVRYRLPDGERKTVVAGNYPAMSLADARGKADEVHLAARTGEPVIGVREEIKIARAVLSQEELAAQEAAEEARKHSFSVLSEA